MINEELKSLVQEFCLMDDTFFNCFMKDNPSGMEYVLNTIMNHNDLHVIKIETQHDVPAMFARGVRFDVFVVDNHGMHYDFEIQRSDEGANPRRARYNCSMMDYLSLNKGNKWEELPENYVIFITENDVLVGDLPIYHIKRRIDENFIKFDDDSNIIYVNGAYKDNSTKLSQLMHDFRCKNPADMRSKLLADRMKYLKSTETEVNSMCKIMEDYGDKRFALGIAQGVNQERIRSAQSLINANITTLEQLANSNLYTKDELKAIATKPVAQ